MGRPFSEEIEHLPHSINWATSLNIKEMKRAVTASAGCNLLVVGSGGSSTAANFMSVLHELRFGDISRSLTPLEYATLPLGLRNTFSVLLSAEGKNKDILAVASHLAARGLKGIAITLTQSNFLVSKCTENGSPTPFAYDMPWAKDGYLATNSLIAMMVIIARAYSKDDVDLIRELAQLDLPWFVKRRKSYEDYFRLRDLSSARQVIVLYGERGKVAAIDIESKLSESALGFCQQIDYRQFAHGRHLQLKPSDNPPFVVALISPGDSLLAKATLELLPDYVDVYKIELPSDPVFAEIVGVVEAMLLIEAIASNNFLDPGRPDVPEFGRKIHALDFSTLVTSHDDTAPIYFQKKLPWLRPGDGIPEKLSGSLNEFLKRLEQARFRCLVCDFDGTYCDTNLRYEGLDIRLVSHMERLLEAGLVIGFATGRGDSLQCDLRKKISPRYWPKILIGYYSGTEILTLDKEFVPPIADPKFADLEQWLRDTGAISADVTPKAHGGQFGVACPSVRARSDVLEAINYWIGLTGLVGWRAFGSGHSIDVITQDAGKEKVANAMLDLLGCEKSEILCIGDSGQFTGNDYELLSLPLGLSVDKVSLLPDVCWNLLPSGISNASGTLYYLSHIETGYSTAQFSPNFFQKINSILSKKIGSDQ